MHNFWKNNVLGTTISVHGVPRLEVDESKIFGNANKVYIADRASKDYRVFCLMDNRSKETLLPIVKKNAFT